MCRILVVEDDPRDAELIRESLEKLPATRGVHVVHTGEEALAFLEEHTIAGTTSRVGLVLLDLRMPGRDGLEVLRSIKEHPTHRNTPVVVLTASKEEADTWRCYHSYANAYVLKPESFDELARALQATVEFYCGVALPAPAEPPSMRTAE